MSDDTDLQLSKDIGKVSERVGKIETGMDHVLSTLIAVDGRMAGMDARMALREEHDAVMCSLARVGLFFLKVLVPSFGTVLAIGLALREFGVWQ